MKLIKLTGVVAFVLGISSCNTLIGVGRDFKQAGKSLGKGITKGSESVGEGIENKGYGKTWDGQ